MKQDSRPGRIVAVMMAITIIGKAMGLLRDRMQAIQFGADTAESIAFGHASVLPRSFLDIMFAAAFSASFIPVFSMYLETKGKRAAFDLAALFISVTTVLTVGVTVVAILFAQPIFVISLGAGTEFPYGTVQLGTTLLRLMLPLMVLSGLAFSFTGILQALGEFRIPAAMSIVSNGVILVYYFFFIDRFGVYGLAVAFLIGWGMQGAIQLPFLIRNKFRFRFRIDFKDPGLRKIGKLALPVMAGTWVLPVNLLVNARAAAGLYGGEFGVNAIYFANSLFMITSGVFILSVSNVIFPKLAREAIAKDMKGFSITVNETVLVLLFFLLPLTFGLMGISAPLIALIHGGGQFGETAVHITGIALFYFAPGVVGYGLMILLSRACFALMDGRTPVIAAVVAIVTNAVLSFALAPHMEVAGPALANAIGQTLGAVVLAVALTRKGVMQWPGRAVLSIVKMVAIAAIMFATVYVTHAYTAEMHTILQVVVPTAVGGVVYLGLAMVLRLKQMWWFFGRAR